MKMLKELKWEAILTGVLYILLGIVALVIPETMQKTLGYLIGIVLIVAGLVNLADTVKSPEILSMLMEYQRLHFPSKRRSFEL